MLTVYCPLATTEVADVVEARAIVFRDGSGNPLLVPYLRETVQMEDVADDVVRNFYSRSLQRDIPLLREHIWGEALGWVERLEKRDDGVYAVIRLNDDGRDLLAKGKYRYVSPGLARDYQLATGRIVPGWVMLELSLTNFPAQTELARVLLSEQQVVLVPEHMSGGSEMDEQKLQDLLKGMIQSLQEQLDAQLETRMKALLQPILQQVDEQRKQARVAELSQRIQSWRFRREGETLRLAQDGDLVVSPAIADYHAKVIAMLPEDQQEQAMVLLQKTPPVLVPLSVPHGAAPRTSYSASTPQDAAVLLAAEVRKVRREHPEWDTETVWAHVSQQHADLVRLYEGGSN